MELLVEENGVGFLVLLEEITDSRPVGGSGLIILHGAIKNVIGTRALDPALHRAIRLGPGGIGICWCSVGAVKVVHGSEFATHGLEEGRPFGVAGRFHVKDKWHMGANSNRGVRVDEEGWHVVGLEVGGGGVVGDAGGGRHGRRGGADSSQGGPAEERKKKEKEDLRIALLP